MNALNVLTPTLTTLTNSHLLKNEILIRARAMSPRVSSSAPIFARADSGRHYVPPVDTGDGKRGSNMEDVIRETYLQSSGVVILRQGRICAVPQRLLPPFSGRLQPSETASRCYSPRCVRRTHGGTLGGMHGEDAWGCMPPCDGMSSLSAILCCMGHGACISIYCLAGLLLLYHGLSFSSALIWPWSSEMRSDRALGWV